MTANAVSVSSMLRIRVLGQRTLAERQPRQCIHTFIGSGVGNGAGGGVGRGTWDGSGAGDGGVGMGGIGTGAGM